MAGVIESYIHTANQIGALVELRCQSKTTATTSEFKTLAREIAMQVAVSSTVKYIQLEDIPQEIVDRVKKTELRRNDLAEKPDGVREKIVFDRIARRLTEIALLPQPYIRDDSLTIEDLIKLNADRLAEPITVRRFARFTVEDDENPSQPNGGVPTNPFPITPTPSADEAEATEATEDGDRDL